MVKKTVGLPEGYDLKVTPSELLEGPATLSGYLDDDRPLRQAAPVPVHRIEEPTRPAVRVTPKVEEVSASVVSVRVTPEPQKPLEVLERRSPKVSREKVRRLQINMTPDAEKKAEELLEILSRQSPDGRVTVSELMQALILNLHDARDDINGRLPQRGRWGTPSAKSYPAELAIVLREALLKNGNEKGGDTFKNAIGQ